MQAFLWVAVAVLLGALVYEHLGELIALDGLTQARHDFDSRLEDAQQLRDDAVAKAVALQAEVDAKDSALVEATVAVGNARFLLAECQAKLAANTAAAEAAVAARGPLCPYVFHSGQKCIVPALWHEHHVTGSGNDALIVQVKDTCRKQPS